MSLKQGHHLGRSCANVTLGKPSYDTKIYFLLKLWYVFTNKLSVSLFECDLPAFGWEIGSVCFQCIQEEAELDSGTSCVPVGGSPVQSHTQTL